MKRICSVILLLSVFVSTLSVFASCSTFIGGIKGFYNETSDDFYENVYEALSNIIGTPESFQLLEFDDEESQKTDVTVSVNDYEYERDLGDYTSKFDVSLLLTQDFDFELMTNLDAFGQKANLNCIVEKDSFYLNAGEFSEKPFYYKGKEDKGLFQNIKDEVIAVFKAGEYINGKEAYKLHGVNFEADTVEICLNSDTTTEFIGKICDLFIETENKIYGSYINDVLNASYLVSGEKLHLTWKRYYNDGALVRESFKVHDNNAHYIILDTAFLEKKNDTYLELTVKAFDGNGEFNVFSLSSNTVETKSNGVTALKTSANILVGDEIHIETSNNCSEDGSKGNASVHFMTEVGESDMKVNFSCTPKNNTYVYKVSSDSIYITFDADITVCQQATSKKPSILLDGECYDIAVLENRYYYDEAKNMLNKQFSDVVDIMKGNTPEPDPEPPKSEVEPYKLDIHYDYSIKNETNGSYGKKYIDILQSGNFTYSYTYHANEEGYPLNSCTQYRKDDETLYKYEYEDGTEYIQLFSGTTRYEVRHDLKKILFTEYSEEDFERFYPEQVYIFYESGFCVYENRELVYEKYYDYSNNKYTFIFDENGKVELIVVESSSDKSLLYTFVDEIKDTAPEDAFELPSYEYQSVLDHFQ